MADVGEGQVKRRQDDCDMISSLTPFVLSRNELCFLEAARKNRNDIVKKIIVKRAVQVDCRDHLDHTALHFAASKGNVDVIQTLIAAKATIDAVDKFGMTPLMWAAYYGQKQAVESLVSYGADPKKINKQLQGIIHLIAQTDQAEVFESARKRNRRLKLDTVDMNQSTPLLLAAAHGSVNMLEILIEEECDITAKDKFQRNALHLAAKANKLPCLKKLLEEEDVLPMINDKDSNQMTPLHYAVLSGNEVLVKTILESKYTLPEITTEHNMTPLMLAAKTNNKEIVKLLLKGRININAKNSQGNTALHLSALENLPEICSILLESGAEIDALNLRLQSPLLYAVEQNKVEAAEILLLKGANSKLIDQTGKTVLLLAARNGSLSMVDLIIKANRLRARQLEAEEKARKSKRDEEDYNLYEAQQHEDPGDDLSSCKAPSCNSELKEVERIYNIHAEEILQRDFYREGYRLIEFNQIYADEFKVYLWRLASKHLRVGEWKKLGQHWGFAPEEILAIEYHQSGEYSYKQHSYRLLCIWFHGLDSYDTPVRQLYEALVAIGRRKLADRLRSELDAGAEALVKPSSSKGRCVIS